MKNLILAITFMFALSGCSMLPRLTFDTPNTLPQSVERGKNKNVCKGEAKFNSVGEIVYCSDGYYAYSENYNKEERKMTIVERIRSWINNILGWGIPGLIIICVLFPGAFTLIGTFIGRFIEGSFGIAKKALTSTVRGIQNTRKNGKDINDSLSAEQDEKVKKYIRKLKEQEKIK